MSALGGLGDWDFYYRTMELFRGLVTIPPMQDMTPRQIVDALDLYIIGQAPAKRAVAVAIRNWINAVGA